MKNYLKITAAAILALAAASCQKEEPVNTPATSGEGKTFTATIAATKTALSDAGVQTFTAGDYILVSNGDKLLTVDETTGAMKCSSPATTEVDGKITIDGRVAGEWIEITDAMVGSGGKSLTFTTTVDEPTSNYYFYIVGTKDGAPYKGQIYSIATDGTVNNRNKPNVKDKEQEFLANLIGTCAKDASSVSFINTLSYFSFKSTGKNYYAVSIMANNGDIERSYVVNTSGTVTAYNNVDTGTPKFSTSTGGAVTCYLYNTAAKNSATQYLPVAPGVDFVGGFTILAWPTAAGLSAVNDKLTLAEIKAKSDWASGAAPDILSTSSDFSTVAGQVINLGDISKVKKFTTYKEMWDAKKKIVIGDKTFDPNALTLTGVHVSSDTEYTTTFNVSTGGIIFFIDKGVTLTLNPTADNYPANKTFIFIGNDLDGGLGKLRFDGSHSVMFKGGCDVAFKGLDIEARNVYNPTLREGGDVSTPENSLIFDGCKIDLSPITSQNTAIVKCNSRSFKNISVVNNDIIYAGSTATGGTETILYLYPNGSESFTDGSIVVKKNLCYTVDGSLPGTAQNQSIVYLGNTESNQISYGLVDVENNTFVNAIYRVGVVQDAQNKVVTATGGVITIKNNLRYVNGSPAGYSKIVGINKASYDALTPSVTNSDNYAYATSNVGRLQSYQDIACTALADSPFSAFDYTTGTFTLTSAFTSAHPGVGAVR